MARRDSLVGRIALAALRPGVVADLAGRVVGPARAGGGLRLRDVSGEADVRLPADSIAPPVGALVRIRATPGDDGVLRAERLEIAGLPALRPDEAPEWSAPGWESRRARIVARDLLLRTLRAHFAAEGFLEVETPVLVAAPGQEPHLRPFETAYHGRAGSRPMYLATSPEYAMKRLLALGFERIFQVTRSFRDGADELSPLHHPEFTLLEWYRAWEGLGDVARDVERLLAATATALRGTPRIERSGRACDLAAGAAWISVEQAFRELADVDLEPYLDGDDAAFVASLPASVRRVGDGAREQADSAYFRLLIERIEPELGIGRPAYLCRYPARHAALAELCGDDARVAERFESYVLGIELGNAFQELRDPAEQERRLRAEQRERLRAGGAALPIDDGFLAALRSGLPPCAGIAIGVDRLHLLLAGARQISDVRPFSIER